MISRVKWFSGVGAQSLRYDPELFLLVHKFVLLQQEDRLTLAVGSIGLVSHRWIVDEVSKERLAAADQWRVLGGGRREGHGVVFESQLYGPVPPEYQEACIKALKGETL